MSHNYSAITLAVFGVLLAGSAFAVDFEPMSANLGGFEVTPSLGLTLGRDSNVGLKSGAQTASNFTMLNPRLSIGLPTHGQLYGLNYSGVFARYTGSKTDNYLDHNFRLYADNVWSARVNSKLNVDYTKGHDGRNALLFVNKELWHNTGVSAMAHYGAEGAQGQFEVSAGQQQKRYDSNISGATQLYNHNTTDLSGTFFYRVAPATQMFIEASNSKFTYQTASPKSLDSTQQSYMVGVKWDATAKTSGSAKFGTMKKTFSLGQLPSATSTVWDAGVKWAPKTYSIVEVSLAQKGQEYGGAGSFILSRDADVSWKHDWTSYVTSTLKYVDGTDTFKADPLARVDKRQAYGLGVTYGFRPWLRAGIGYDHTKRTSTNAVVGYTKSVTMFTLEGSL